MAIQKPYDIKPNGIVTPAEEDILISWKTSGGIQTSFAIEIKDNNTNTIVFTLPKTSSYSHQYNLLANSLTNGKEYKMTIQVWDEDDNTSISDPVIFETSSRPVITINATGIVVGQEYSFSATYSQAESIPIRSWVANLYNNEQTLISTSGLQLTSTLEYLFGGLQSETSYYIEFQATSNKGIVGTSGLIPFDVLYSQPTIQSALSAENYDNASIRLLWSIVQIIGQSENTSFINNEKINATNGKVWFNQGFNIEDNFTLKIWIESVTNYNYNINHDVPIIAYYTQPSNPNALWIQDSSQLTEKVLALTTSPAMPSQDSLWIQDLGLIQEKQLTLVADLIDPTQPDIALLDLGGDDEKITLLKLKGSNGTIYLRYFNNKFYLFRNEELIGDISAFGNSYYVYIQQIGDTLSFDTEVLS